MDAIDYMRLHTEALYTYDSAGRLLGCNQFDGGPVPRFHLARSDRDCFGLFRGDVPDQAIEVLTHFIDMEPPLQAEESEPIHRERYLEILRDDSRIEDVWCGPVYRFPRTVRDMDPRVIRIDESNQGLLRSHMQDWMPDVPHRSPFFGVLVDGQFVAVCASARMSPSAHEAGVETSPSHRKQGFAVIAVKAWASAVSELNAVPLYSTSWENLASQSVAKSLGLEFIGSDFHVR